MEAANLGHLMVDIETLGNKSNSVICSVAALEFNLATGETGREFYQRISIQSCLDAGLKVDGSTIEWWLKQSEAARLEIAQGGSVLREVLFNLNTFIWLLGNENLQVWGNGARFDLGILENAYHATCYPVPWLHWNERDVRTLVSFAPDIKKNIEFTGTAHNALADCYHQVKYCSAIYQNSYGNNHSSSIH